MQSVNITKIYKSLLLFLAYRHEHHCCKLPFSSTFFPFSGLNGHFVCIILNYSVEQEYIESNLNS